MYSDFYEIPLPALRFEKVEETDTKKWKSENDTEEKRRLQNSTTSKSRQENDAQRKADSLAKKNDTQRKLNASRTKAFAQIAIYPTIGSDISIKRLKRKT